ncbi:MAG: fasciclin domain-containing protein [Acidobacteriota bacterium]
MKRARILGLLLLSALLASTVWAGDYKAKADIVDTAVKAGKFQTLVKAVQAAGLVETLKGKGPFTVFAPTDEAFAKLPAGTLENLLKDKAKLTAILTYHVVPGKLTASDVLKSNSLGTLQGNRLAVKASPAPMVDNARIVQTDIECSNGVIHVIDTVVLPD